MQQISPFNLPSVEVCEGRLFDCAICGSRPNPAAPEDEHIRPNGMSSYSPDIDLCLECAIHFWRAFKAAHPSDYGNAARDLLRGYCETRDSCPAETELTKMPVGLADFITKFRALPQ